jgi:hypothetical protein
MTKLNITCPTSGKLKPIPVQAPPPKYDGEAHTQPPVAEP